ncbi:MAG: sulfur carrier protein ThiS adenylyltransferase ThiF [Candidatus Margulisbacteria bacterium]|nr:sulfur carrier protein ThiS adenylyltransferase ThiF [Candidatus Margulisiibacteriota bacterium]MBU1022365.1 sulfur carrier protein ThiS adenylyltransferase ThiF [Candidatus Margulisiibacteriota bacterium]MBU1729083.1 sulfur carrier protein ThiS adenylyltransferase ThiF [Candidatus Margulisiibacteriota bacterium]MBU1954496.1 sulfur carrier protein ThiS adenylyltransferase ThiF [Candidatus Margulisiibacteriota bacterium]
MNPKINSPLDNFEEIFSRNVSGIRAALRGKKIGIAGCGGLGSNLAVNLVRMGADNLVLVDSDKIEPSNLNRQYYFWDQIGSLKAKALEENLKRIHPLITCECHSVRINSSNLQSIFSGCEVVAECFDGAGDKARLVEDLVNKGIPVVAVSGVAGKNSAEAIKIKRPIKNLILIGDDASPDCSEGLISPRVSIAAAHQAWAIMNFLSEGEKNESDR